MTGARTVADSGEPTVRQRLRVLLLEDNPAEARLVEESVRDFDPAIDCDIATELWQVSPERLAAADCAVIDLGLPDATDVEAVRWIRDLAPEIPIVVLTGFDDEVTGQTALLQGAQDFLVKQHADGYLIARAIRFAVVRMNLKSALERQAINDLDLRDEIVDQLFDICQAMRTTQAWTRQPSVADRLAEHRQLLERVLDRLHQTFIIRRPGPETDAVRAG